MTITRRSVLKSTFGTIAVPALSRFATAQPYPVRPITLIVPFPAGGPTDVIARVIAERLRTLLGQTVIVENTSGAANGSVGVGQLVRSAPDGYTFGIGHWSSNVVNGAIYTLPYDLLRDLEPIALVATNPLVLVGKKDLVANTLPELLSWLRAHPDQGLLGTAGVGSPPRVAGTFFQTLTQTRLRFVHYRGGAPAMQDLLGGQIDLLIPQPPIALPLVTNGKIKAYAITARNRLSIAPEIPTAEEAGAPGFELSVWHGFWAPKGIPQQIVSALNAATVAALADANVKKTLAEIGQDIPPPEQQTPQALAQFQKSEIERWWPIIKAANIKVDQ
jgi:tripartite-type tricarboxylate transporter receptor subunit TctC